MAGALLLVSGLRKQRKIPRTKDGGPLPSPSTTLPLLHNTLDFVENAERMHDWICETSLSFGGQPWLLHVVGQPNMVILTSPGAFEDVEHRLFDKFGKGPFLHEYMHDLGGDSMVFVDGEMWSYQRKVAAKLFSTRAIREHMNAIVNKHVEVLGQVFEKYASSGAEVDVAELLLRLTTDTISEIAFGVDLDCLGSDSIHPFEKALDNGADAVMKRMQLPTFVWKIQRMFGLGLERQLKESVVIIDKLVMGIIKHAIQKSQDASTKSKDAISLFLESETSEGRLTPELLRDVAVTLLIGGRNSTAETTSWLLYRVAQRPDVEAKIRQEIVDKLGVQLEASDFITTEKLQQLTYTEAVVRETLRLYPAASWNMRYCNEDAVLSDGTFIPQGSYAVFAPYTTAKRTDVWGDDAADFKPERWLDPTDPSKLITVSNFKFNTFLAGPRQCLGMNLALMTIKTVVVKTLSTFHLSLSAGQENITYRHSTSLPLKGGLRARVHHVID